MSERAIVLKTEKLGMMFGGLKAVNDFNIEILEGELVGLIGPNGSGKTTVFNMLTGLHIPFEGEIYLMGKRITGMKTHKIIEQGIARTFQNIRLFGEMSVLENVKTSFTKDVKYNLFDTMFRTPKYFQIEKDIEDKAMDCLRIVHLDDKAAFQAKSLPYGQQRKLEIARALATDMKLLLLDEPAAGMNPTETSELIACIYDIRKKFNITIFLIEHDMSLVMKICERIQVINFGNTIAHGFPNEIAHNPDVIEAYLGEEAVENA
ncbi:MAG: ABC transporter ATP-binding protein [Clostridiales bacterium]|nr:ABC transporter ATP-binding protein [Clostridiales bacterium]